MGKAKYRCDVGDRFGWLTVIGKPEFIENGYFCLARCDCGTERMFSRQKLVLGRTKSCGCFRLKGDWAVRHAHARKGRITSEYRSWANMMTRCYNVNNHAFERYGGRGIKVCKRWHKFDNFIADMGLKPAPRLTIERVDNNKGYSPKNCCWATYAQQSRNRRNVKNANR